ncbi:MAG: PEP-CTERM sorting domain-containing protein [Verrucomicrobiae bacterium]|nr:PEP-CTERM sorting domain-containing protein [Verrucomicrobiae bacterium]NNJ44207.1 PEP-CTERM sorting domain-containing protein [Akkermansiaceae bacterium]
MDGDSMGHGNDKWGNLQNWTFSLDQTISFDDMTFKTINETITLRSTAWVGDADASGTGWSFTTDATYGTFSILGASGPGTYDITTAGVSDVAAGTDITFGYLGGAGGGEELSSFTITAAPVPEPSSTALLGLGGLALILRRRK